MGRAQRLQGWESLSYGQKRTQAGIGVGLTGVGEFGGARGSDSKIFWDQTRLVGEETVRGHQPGA